jgi:predicted HicB family RNase H-like nuclease
VNTLSYKGYQARIEFDGEDLLFVGRIAGINDVVGFHCQTVAELETAFREAVDDYVATCESLGKVPEKAFSGNLQLRIDPAKHAKLALGAQLAGVSLNQYASSMLDAAIARDAA